MSSGITERTGAARNVLTMGNGNGKRLGEYLKARRGLVTPQEAGIAVRDTRRVPGLRRDEVAQLAGISLDYYVRLEQGRDQNPSAQVIDALARALNLDAAATAHLYSLANPLPGTPALGTSPTTVTVADSTHRLIDMWSDVPAVVQNRYMDVLVANALATAMAPMYTPGNNLLRCTFLSRDVRTRYPDWDDLALRAVAGLRALAGHEEDDPYLADLVDELCRGSENFRTLWARHDVSPPPGGTVEINHPAVGRLSLRYERLGLSGDDGTLLIVHLADPGSPSERALRQLAALVAGAAGPDGMDEPAESDGTVADLETPRRPLHA